MLEIQIAFCVSQPQILFEDYTVLNSKVPLNIKVLDVIDWKWLSDAWCGWTFGLFIGDVRKVHQLIC